MAGAVALLEVRTGEGPGHLPAKHGVAGKKVVGDPAARLDDLLRNILLSKGIGRVVAETLRVEGGIVVASVVLPDDGAAVFGRHQVVEGVPGTLEDEGLSVRLCNRDERPLDRDGGQVELEDQQQKEGCSVFHSVQAGPVRTQDKVSHFFAPMQEAGPKELRNRLLDVY